MYGNTAFQPRRQQDIHGSRTLQDLRVGEQGYVSDVLEKAERSSSRGQRQPTK